MLPIILLIAMMGAMYFMQRNQKKQAQDHLSRLKKLEKGTDVVTIGGLHGRVDEVNLDDNTVVLDIDGVYLTFELLAIKTILASENPAPIVEEVEVVEESAIEE